MPASPILMQGNEAVAEGAIAAGARFFAGYPITPSTEIAETLSRRMPEVGGSFLQMEDEIASIAAVCGASLAGQKAFTATSGPGFSLMQEMIGFASMAQIPCVIVDVMRGGPSTGLPTEPSQGDVMQARWGTHGEHSVIALVPSSVYECYTLTVAAFNLAEQYRTPVIVLSDALIGQKQIARAAQLCRELLGKDAQAEHVTCAALRLLASADGAAALPELVTATKSKQPAVRSVATELAAFLK